MPICSVWERTSPTVRVRSFSAAQQSLLRHSRRQAFLATLRPRTGFIAPLASIHRWASIGESRLSRAQEGHVAMLHDHRATLATLAEKATSAAAIFVKHDEMSGSALDTAAQAFS